MCHSLIVLWEKSGEWEVITVVLIRLKKVSTYYVSDPVLHGWGWGDTGVRPHYCAPVVLAYVSGKPHPDQVS